MKDKTGRGDDGSRPRKADKRDHRDVTAEGGDLPPIVVKRPPRLRSKRSDGDDDRRG